jgi:hypothetical protein
VAIRCFARQGIEMGECGRKQSAIDDFENENLIFSEGSREKKGIKRRMDILGAFAYKP